MRRLHLVAVLVALAVALPLIAAEPEAATGSYSIMAVKVLSVQPIANGCFSEWNVTFGFKGTFTGVLNTNVIVLSKSPCGQPAPQEMTGEGMFVGTVDGIAGGADIEFSMRHDDQRIADGTLVVRGGDADLAKLHAFLRLTGIGGIGGVYDGAIRFGD